MNTNYEKLSIHWGHSHSWSTRGDNCCVEIARHEGEYPAVDPAEKLTTEDLLNA